MTFKPGQSGNPGGRPKKGFSIREHLRNMMSEEITIPGKDGRADTVMTKGAIVSSKLFQAAASGDLTAIKICIDNIDGPPTQGVELSGKDANGGVHPIGIGFIQAPKMNDIPPAARSALESFKNG
jgi:hypothetical protein